MMPLMNIDVTLGWRRLPCQDLAAQVVLKSGKVREGGARRFLRPETLARLEEARAKKEAFMTAFMTAFRASGMKRRQLWEAVGVAECTVDKWVNMDSFPTRETGAKLNALFGLGFDDLDFLAKGKHNGNGAN